MENDLELLLSGNHWDYRHAQLHTILSLCSAGERAKSLTHAKQVHYLPTELCPQLTFFSCVVCEAGRHSLALLQKDTVKAKYGHMQKVPDFQQVLRT